jgi:hypothetical protein
MGRQTPGANQPHENRYDRGFTGASLLEDILDTASRLGVQEAERLKAPSCLTRSTLPGAWPAAIWRVGVVFFKQLAPTGQALGIDRACGRGFLHRAARLVSVRAVAELAAMSKIGDLGKQRLDTIGGVAYV